MSPSVATYASEGAVFACVLNLLLHRYTCCCVLLFVFTDTGSRKLRYAEKMAAAHRKSAGLGEFAPEDTSYVKTRDGQAGVSSKWTQADSNSVDDEFDF